MAAKTETQHFVQSIHELPHDGSRENITVLSGQNLLAGAVVGRVALGVGRASVPIVVGTGNGTMSLVSAGPDIEEGNYVVQLKTVVTNGGVFSVTAPSGKALSDFTLTPGAGVTTAYKSSHVNFSITDGATDFALNDAFTIVVGATAPIVVGTGNGTISGLSLGPDAKPGLYRVECIAAVLNGGNFKMVGPDGNQIADGFIVAGAGGTLVLSDQRQLNLTITDGATDFVVGDAFNVAVFNKGERGKGKIVAYAPGTSDGRHRVAGVLAAAVDASASDLPGLMISRQAIVEDDSLGWGTLSAAEKQAARSEMARERGIMVR